MSRPIVLSNGNLHVGMDENGLVHDFYFPYVGLENHSASRELQHRIGVYVDGLFSWLDDGMWSIEQSYPHHSLIGHTIAVNAGIGVRLEFDDYVVSSMNAIVRSIHVINTRDQPRSIKLFMHQVFAISNARNGGDTVQVLPSQPAILHYKGHRSFVVGGYDDTGSSFDQYSVGVFGIEGREGTFRDAEDGLLSGNSVEHGSVDSVIGFTLHIDAHDSRRVTYSVSAGETTREALAVNERIKELGNEHYMNMTAEWWHGWLATAKSVGDKLTTARQDIFYRSLMLVKSHIDNRGAIIASTDTTMLNYSRDAYAYCWPRDAALVLWPLIRLGYTDEALRFFGFCERIIHPDGYVMHKYQSDGALGSSWHSYIHDGGVVAPPIQEDETAIVLFMLGQFFDIHNKQTSLLQRYYRSLIKPMADFIADYRDTDSGMARPSFDLWEETYGVHTYTVAVAYAGLIAAANLADKLDQKSDATTWRQAAEELRSAAKRSLYDSEKKFFRKNAASDSQDTRELQAYQAVDMSSFYGAVMFGLWPADSPELPEAYQTLLSTFGVPSEGPHIMPRYEHDDYNRTSAESLGNPWFITSLWMAQYNLGQGRVDIADSTIDWVIRSAMPTGVLAEQINADTGDFLSVAPLAWSQAELINTLIDTVHATVDKDSQNHLEQTS